MEIQYIASGKMVKRFTLWFKKQATLFSTITLSNIDHFEYNLVQRSMNNQETNYVYNVRLT
jgi:hypothetical protein